MLRNLKILHNFINWGIFYKPANPLCDILHINLMEVAEGSLADSIRTTPHVTAISQYFSLAECDALKLAT